MNMILIQIGVQIFVKTFIFSAKSEDMILIPIKSGIQIAVNMCFFFNQKVKI